MPTINAGTCCCTASCPNPHGCGTCIVGDEITVVISGISNGFCFGCDSINGVYTLTWVSDPAFTIAGATTCTWRYDGYDSGCGSIIGPIAVYYGNDNVWHFEMALGANGSIPGTLSGTFNCNGLNTYTIDDSLIGGYCVGPVTAIVDVRCPRV